MLAIEVALKHLDTGDVEAARKVLQDALEAHAAKDGSVFRLVYRSRSRLNRQGFEELLLEARMHNAMNGITGALIEKDDVFLQILEGEERQIRELFRKIEKDPRHCQVIPLLARQQPKRLFSGWNMASVHINQDLFDGFMQRSYRGDSDVDALLHGFLKEGKFL